jgi:hypothetical protein
VCELGKSTNIYTKSAIREGMLSGSDLIVAFPERASHANLLRAKLRGLRVYVIFPMAGLACIAGLSACIGPAPSMRDNRTAVISGRVTAGLSATDATRKALSEAAKITVDHGFRYFMIANPQNASASTVAISPGANLTIRTFRAGEIRRNAPGVWDADAILSSGAKDAANTAKSGSLASRPTVTAPSR